MLNDCEKNLIEVLRESQKSQGNMEPLANCGECLDEVMAHPWLKDIDIDQLMYKVVDAPFKPKVDQLEIPEDLDPALTAKESTIPVDKAVSKEKDHLHFRKFEDKP